MEIVLARDEDVEDVRNGTRSLPGTRLNSIRKEIRIFEFGVLTSLRSRRRGLDGVCGGPESVVEDGLRLDRAAALVPESLLQAAYRTRCPLSSSTCMRWSHFSMRHTVSETGVLSSTCMCRSHFSKQHTVPDPRCPLINVYVPESLLHAAYRIRYRCPLFNVYAPESLLQAAYRSRPPVPPHQRVCAGVTSPSSLPYLTLVSFPQRVCAESLLPASYHYQDPIIDAYLSYVPRTHPHTHNRGCRWATHTHTHPHRHHQSCAHTQGCAAVAPPFSHHWGRLVPLRYRCRGSLITPLLLLRLLQGYVCALL